MMLVTAFLYSFFLLLKFIIYWRHAVGLALCLLIHLVIYWPMFFVTCICVCLCSFLNISWVCIIICHILCSYLWKVVLQQSFREWTLKFVFWLGDVEFLWSLLLCVWTVIVESFLVDNFFACQPVILPRIPKKKKRLYF